MIERVYAAFATYRLGRVEGCPCCVSETERAALCARRLRDHDAESLGRYAWKAISTWGDEADFKHFLPRILELALAGGLDLDQVIGKIQYAKWDAWPVDERAVIVDALRLHWAQTLLGEPWKILEVAAAIAPLVGEATLTAMWEARLDEAGAMHRLAAVIIEASQRRAPPLGTWLYAQAPRLERAFEIDPCDEIARAVDLATLCHRGTSQ